MTRAGHLVEGHKILRRGAAGWRVDIASASARVRLVVGYGCRKRLRQTADSLIQRVTAFPFKYVVNVVPQVRGRVVEVPVEPNRPVKKGDVLVELDEGVLHLDLGHARSCFCAWAAP